MRVRLWSTLSLGMMLILSGGQANALPGQTTEEATAWIQAHPTLRPTSGEKLLVRKSDTPAQRFVFQASVLPAGKVAPPRNAGLIRSERLSIFDMVNGVNRPRLEESLRVLYGVDVYQDYDRARIVYAYPNSQVLGEARDQVAPLLSSLQGELRLGERYAYWMEIAQTPNGYAYTGQMTVLVKGDLAKLETELRDR